MPSTTEVVLLDANVLITLSEADHEHHERARAWLGDTRPFATCPSTQSALVRFLVRVASVGHAGEALRMLATNPRHEFWPDLLPYDSGVLDGVHGHRQVTDAYLARIAVANGSTVATFDGGLKRLRPTAVDLLD